MSPPHQDLSYEGGFRARQNSIRKARRSIKMLTGGWRDELLQFMRRTTERPGDFPWHPHPGLGQRSDAAWIAIQLLHIGQHLRQFGC